MLLFTRTETEFIAQNDQREHEKSNTRVFDTPHANVVTGVVSLQKSVKYLDSVGVRTQHRVFNV